MTCQPLGVIFFGGMIDIGKSQSENRCYAHSQWLQDEGGILHAGSVWSLKDQIIYWFSDIVSGE